MWFVCLFRLIRRRIITAFSSLTIVPGFTRTTLISSQATATGHLRETIEKNLAKCDDFVVARYENCSLMWRLCYKTLTFYTSICHIFNKM